MATSFKEIFIRKETYRNEHRTPLTPNDVEILIRSGFTVFVEKSRERAYTDEEYERKGGILTPFSWPKGVFPFFNSCLIIGLKELENIQYLDQHSHAYFSHSFKGQKDSASILTSFSRSQSRLYDFEYFLSSENKRMISFGFYAGCVGAVLGILHYKKQLPSPLKPWDSFETMIQTTQQTPLTHNLKIGIIGASGRCGKGVQKVLETLGIPFTVLDKVSDISRFKDFDIFYNCIKLEESYSEVWFHSRTQFEKPILIVDISCDASKKNQPIQLYSQATTWDSPVYSYNPLVDIIAIDNLPSLLPRESSEHFSSVLVNLLVNKEHAAIWKKAHEIFLEVSKNSLPPPC